MRMRSDDRTVALDMDWRTKRAIVWKLTRDLTDEETAELADASLASMTDAHKRTFHEVNEKCGGLIACQYLSMITGHNRKAMEMYYTLLDMY